MPQFSQISKTRLATCHPTLQQLCNELIVYIDFMVVCGFRSEQEQEEAYRKGFSKVRWPNSKHNTYPSLAVDLAPYPLNWQDTERFKELAYFIMGYALAKKLNITWGGDWNKNYTEDDERWIDLPHYQLEVTPVQPLIII